MKGAEIALVGGVRIKVGRGESCDIVIADSSLAEEAFDLDVGESAVTLILPDGLVRELKDFEVHAFGTTSIAVGPAEGTWEELRPAPAPVEETEPSEPESSAEPDPKAEEGAEPAKPDEDKRSRSSIVIRILAALAVLAVLLLLLLIAIWFLRQRNAARADGVDAAAVAEQARVARSTATLRELAEQHGLSLSEKDGHPLLSGNALRRTERLAIRALALAADRSCILDLSDDETLANSAEALLFTVTEGALKPLAASNRTVVVTGFAPDVAALAGALEALRTDVPWVKDVDVQAVKVGGAVPEGLKDKAFAVTGALSEKRDFSPASGDDFKTQAVAKADAGVGAETNAVDGVASGRKLPRNMFPVAGILTRPYPCVVLRDGHRIVEGGQLGGYTVTGITAGSVELQLGDRRTIWEP